MKKKFILITAVVALLIVLCASVMPAMSPDVGVGIAGESTSAGAMNLATMDSEAVLVIDNAVPVSASTAEMSMWLALGAILVTFAVVFRRRLYNFFAVKNSSHRRSSDSTDEGAKVGGGPNKFILPAAA